MKIFSPLKKLFLAGLVISLSGCKPVGQIFDDFLPPTNPSININSGASLTNSIAVTLTLSATDAHQMYITNTSGCSSGGGYETYASTKSWLLGQSNGVATVYAKFRDRKGNESGCVSASISHDSVAPSVSMVNSTTANGSYKVGEVISIQVNFSEAVTVSGTPTLTLETGATDRAVIYTSGSGTTALTFNYTVQTGDTSSDLDYVATTSLALNSGTIQDAAGNNATLSLPTPGAANSLGANKALVVDTTSPTITAFSSSTANGSYKAGATININATASETVQAGGTFNVTLDTGAVVTLTAAAQGTAFSGTYTVVAGHNSTDLKVSSFTAGTVLDLVGNQMTGTTLPAGANISDSKDIKVDTSAPTITAFSSSTANGSYKAGATININATASETVQAGATFDVTLDTGTVVTLTAAVQGTSFSGTYTVVAGQNSADLTVSSFSAGTVLDVAGNQMTGTTLPAGANISDSKDIKVDTTAPTITAFSSSTANGSYKAGATININATSSETVQAGGTFDVTLDTGAVVTLTAAAQGTAFSGTYTVVAGHNSTDLTVLSFTAGNVLDVSGNQMTSSTLPAGANIADSKDIKVDTTAPTITAFSSSKADGTYLAGATININATASETVQAGGTFNVTLDTGAVVTLTAAVQGTAFSGTYTVVAGQNSADLTVSSFSAGTVLDVSGNQMTGTALPVGANIADSKDIKVDTTAPTIIAFSSSKADGTYLAGATININATASETVQAGGTFNVTLDTGAVVTLTAAAQGTAFSGTYTVVAGQNSVDLTVSSFTAGTVLDLVGNQMNSTSLPAGANIADSKDIKVDTTAPTITAFSSSTANGSYKAGATININATASETVQAGGTFNVTLDTGAVVTLTAAAQGTAFSGTYTVVAGQNTADLTVSSFTAGTVLDLVGNQMTSTSLPAGANIADSKDIKIDTTAPTITAFSSSKANGTYLAGATININATTSETVQAGATFDVTLDTGAVVTLTAAAQGTAFSGTYTVVSGQNSADLTVSTFTAGTVLDLVGNQMTSTTLPAGANISDSKDIVVDASAPTITAFSSSTANGSYKAGATININATASETVQAGGTFNVTLDSGAVVTLTAAVQGTAFSGTYTVVAGQNSADLTVSSFSAGTVLDVAGNQMTTTTLPAGANIANSKDIKVDTTAPTITAFSSSTANGTYVAGATININATASETVQAGGTFNVTLDTGAVVTLTAAAQGTAFSGTYTVVAGENSTDLTVSSFTAGTVLDVAGNQMTSTSLPAGANIADSKNIAVNTSAPTITAFSSSTANGSYKAGATININATASETVQAGGTFNVTLDTGAVVALTAAVQGTVFSGTYTVVAGQNSSDLTVSSYTAGTVLDVDGNQMVGTNLPAGANIADSKDIKVDTTAPTIVAFSSSKANGTYLAGATINISATASETVQAGATFNVSLDSGAVVTLTAAAQGTDFSGTYTVVSGEASSDLTVSFFTAGTVLDVAGNQMTSTSLPAGANIADSKNIVVDAITPTITAFSSSTANGSYKAGATININATASETVQAGGTFNVTLDTGAVVTLTAAAQGTAFSGTYTVVAGQNSADLTVSSFTAGTVLDVAGNQMTSTSLPAGANIANSKDIKVDTTAPTISAFTSSTADGTYLAGATINISATASETIQAGGTFNVTLDTGAVVTLTAAAQGTSFSGTYTVVAGQNSADLTVSSFTAGNVLDIAGNQMTSTSLPAGANIANTSNIVVDPVPVVTNVTSSTSNGTYGVGEVLSIQVVFSEAVTVNTSGGTPTLTLSTGSGTTAVNYTSGSGTTTLSFDYTVGEGHYFSDLDYSATTSLALNSGTIKSSTNASQNAVLTLASPGAANSLSANKDLRSLLYALKLWNVDNDTFGQVLARGDVNGDNYPDVVVGFQSANSGDGRVVVYSGNPSAAFGSVVLMDIVGAATKQEGFGASVATADVNNDGKAEVIIGVPYYDLPGGGTDHGKASVYAYDVNNSSPAPLYSVSGTNADDNLGTAVANLGDLNGDNKEDFLVGAIGVDGGGVAQGQVTIYSGANGSILASVSGDENNDYFGAAVAGIGDINNDGKPDFMVSAPLAAGGGTQRGKVRVYSGADSSVLYTYTGGSDNDQFGASLAGNADVNNDGRPDFMIGSAYVDPTPGAQDRGQVKVYSGIDGSTIYTLNGSANSDYFGQSIDFVGDVDNDGRKDFIIGAPGVTVNGTTKGQATVYKGSDGTALYTINGSETDEQFGYAVVGLRASIENDSRDDFVISAPSANGAGTDRGKIQVYR